MFGFGTEYEGLAFWLPLVWAGLLAVAVAMYVIVDGIRPAPQELREIIGAEAEHEGVDDHKGQKRRRHRAGRDGGDRIRGAQDAVDHIRLAADLGGEPAE